MLQILRIHKRLTNINEIRVYTWCQSTYMVAMQRENGAFEGWDPEISRGGWSFASRNVKNKGKAGEGVAERREPSFNFLLAAAWAANLRLRARFDRKEGRKEGGRGWEAGKEAIEKRWVHAERYKGRNKFLSLPFSLSPCDLHAMNFQFDRTPFDASRRSRLD